MAFIDLIASARRGRRSVIANRFQMTGDIGSLTVAFDANYLPEATFAGLVE